MKGSTESDYRVGILSDISGTNRLALFGPQRSIWNSYILDHCYLSLYRNSDQRFDWIPHLAQDFPSEIQREESFWVSTVCIKERVCWCDGSELTAEDVQFSYAAILALDPVKLGGAWSSFVDPLILDHVAALDRYRIKFYLKQKPGLGRWQYGMLQAPILSKRYWAPKLQRALASSDPIEVMYTVEDAANEPCAGAFIFKDWQKGTQVEKVCNPYYYFQGAKVEQYANGAYHEFKPGFYDFIAFGEPEGPKSLEFTIGPHIDRVLYRVFANEESAISGLMTGELDIILTPWGLATKSILRLKDSHNITLVRNASNSFFYLTYNLRKTPFSDPVFRVALATLIDRENLCCEVLQEGCEPAYSIVPAGNEFWHNPGVQVHSLAISRAQRMTEAVRILKTAGYRWDKEPRVDLQRGVVVEPGIGLRTPGGGRLPEFEWLFPTASYDPNRYKVAQTIGHWLREMGVLLQDTPLEFKALHQRVSIEHLFDLAILGLKVFIYPLHLDLYFHSRYADPRGFNAAGFAQPEYDRLVDAFLAELDLSQARRLAFKLQEVLADELPCVVLYSIPLIEGYRADRLRFPYTQVLDGLHGKLGMPSLVQPL